MALIPSAFVHQRDIQFAIQRVESRFTQQVHHINYNLGENWIGAPSIFFRVVVSDEAFHSTGLRDLTQQVAVALMNEAETDESGLYAYFDFRSVTEQAKFRDPAWA